MKSRRTNTALYLLCATVATLFSAVSFAQPVVVTLKLDASQISVGAATTLHIYGQIVPAQQASAERIFSWNVDLLNASGSIADATGDIIKLTSDKDPQTSSNGLLEGPNRRSIYDTFLDLPGAGVSAPVELFSVPVRGLAQGSAVLSVQAGTGATGLGGDFIVAPAAGGDPFLGADYSQASATLQVGAGACQSSLTAAVQAGATRQLAIQFTLCPGKNHTVQFTDDLAHPNWQALAGAPHNTGSVTDSVTASHRFYRVLTM